MQFSTDNSGFPLVSIIIPAYNRETLISETLNSLAEQTYANWECIVVDDGSSDNTEAIVKSLCKKDSRFKLFKNNRTKGAPGARNTGLGICSGEYVIFLDSDDLLENFCLENRVKYFQKYSHRDFLVFPMVFFWDYKDNIKGPWNIDKKDSDLIRFLRIDAIWSITGPIYKKQILFEMGGFNETLTFWQDYDLHLRLILSGKKYKKFLNGKPDSYYRQHSIDSIGSSTPFVSSLETLKKRIDFFENIVQYIQDNHICLNKMERRALWSTVGFFNSCYLFVHHNHRLFKKAYSTQYRKCRKEMYYAKINYMHDFLLYIRRRGAIHRIYVVYKWLFQKYLLDYNIFTENTLLKTFEELNIRKMDI